MADTITVVVMAYNEAANLEPTVREIGGALALVPGAHEILIVDDGSTDGTGEAADALASADARLRVVHHGVNRGLGGVYRTGFAEAGRDLVTFFPADGQFPASIIGQFAALVAGVDMVLGYLPGRRESLVGRTLSAMERLVYRVVIGPMPRFQGILMFRRTLLEGMALRSTGRGWAVLIELIVRAHRAGARMASAPTPVRPRLSGTSKVQNWRTIVSNLRQALQLRAHLGRG